MYGCKQVAHQIKMAQKMAHANVVDIHVYRHIICAF